MKKIIFIMVILIIILLPCYIFIHYMLSLPNPIITFGWKSVYIKDLGSLKIPRNWNMTLDNNSIFITNKSTDEKDYKIYLAGVIVKYDTFNYLENKDEIDGNWFYFHSGNEFFKNIKNNELVTSEVYSNSTYFGIKKYNIEGNIIEKYYIDLLIENGSINFILWDNLISKDILINIAKTFKAIYN